MTEKDLKKVLKLALFAAKTAGGFLLELKKNKVFFRKLVPDIISERWIISLIKTFYPHTPILSEESYKKKKKFIPKKEFWIIDPLDGTASFREGYPGFCVQIAYIRNGSPLIGVVHAPAMNLTYWAISEKGAYLSIRNKRKKLVLKKKFSFKKDKTYVDSRPQKGVLVKILKRIRANKFLELGSYGLKICKVAEGKADVFLKLAKFKIWDTAPADLILREAGGRLTLWNGENIDYSGKKIYFRNLVAAPPIYHREIISYL